MSTGRRLESTERQSPRERFWQIWGKIVGILVVTPFAILLFATSNPSDSFFERLARSVPLTIAVFLAGLILTILGFPFSRLFSADPRDARPDREGETIAKGILDLAGKFFAQEAGDAGAATAAGAADAVSAQANDGDAEGESRFEVKTGAS